MDGATSAASPGTVAAGSAHVTIDGQGYEFPGSLTCNKPAGNRHFWTMGATATSPYPAALEVDKTTDGNGVQLVAIVFDGNIWGSGLGRPGAPRGVSAQVRNAGNSYTVTGTALNAVTNVVAPFEIDATCP